MSLFLQTTTLRTSSVSRGRGGPTVEKLVFNNHTECVCVDRLEEFMPRDRPSANNDKENTGRRGSRGYYSPDTDRYEVRCEDSDLQSWVMTPCGYWRFGGTFRFHLPVESQPRQVVGERSFKLCSWVGWVSTNTASLAGKYLEHVLLSVACKHLQNSTVGPLAPKCAF